MAINCSCSTALATVTNNPCDALKYGNQIVKVFIQKMAGTTFDGLVNNDVAVEADWDTKIAAVNDDKVIVIGNLSNAIRPSSTPNTESGNIVPYGGEEVIDKPQELTFDLRYLAAADFANLDTLVCAGQIRLWFLDNNDYLWGSTDEAANGDGVLNVSFLTTTYGQGGVGVHNTQAGNKASWNSLEQPVAVGNYPFLRTK